MTRAWLREEKEAARLREDVDSLPGELLWAAADAIAEGTFCWSDWWEPASHQEMRAWKAEVWRRTYGRVDDDA